MKNYIKNLEFSKILLVQESLLIWIVTICFIILAFMSVIMGYLGALPWLSVIAGSCWGAYGVSQAFYYNKAKCENSKGGIKYDTIISQYQQQEDLTLEPEDTYDISGMI